MNNIKNITIGIPKLLMYYKYKNLWITFFNKLNINLVFKESNEKSRKSGSKYIDHDGCNHLKEYLGLVELLLKECDYVLVPDIKNLVKDQTICPIIKDLSSIVKDTFYKEPILSYTIDIKNNKDELTGFIKIGQQLGFKYNDILEAYKLAKYEQELHYINKKNNIIKKIEENKPNILVCGNFYSITDNMKNKFNSNKINYLTSDFTDYRYDELDNTLITTKDTFINEYITSIEQLIDKVDTFILLKESNCFISSLFIDSLKKKLNNKKIYILDLNSPNINKNIDNIKVEVENEITN